MIRLSFKSAFGFPSAFSFGTKILNRFVDERDLSRDFVCLTRDEGGVSETFAPFASLPCDPSEMGCDASHLSESAGSFVFTILIGLTDLFVFLVSLQLILIVISNVRCTNIAVVTTGRWRSVSIRAISRPPIRIVVRV